ncbi:translesion DNA synthesis-associated protein ImuA [Paraburkholderia azotifigens]|uniref:Translesion DNA synthesis-associated protein ImuA n=1 Tax=Paraburkholderia azotifigens TaxID=2057004 RepID=A0ABU9RGY8_9BURK
MALSAESIHPSLWRASQLARGQGRVVETGYPVLSSELPGGGWPTGALVDLLVQQTGVGELRLLRPALSALAPRPVALLQTPQVPCGLGLAYIGVSLERVIHLRAPKSSDALWSAEQILRAGTSGALIYWTQYVQASSLRRLHLAAQASDTLFVMVRPLAAAQDASPAVLRLALRPSTDGLIVDVVKRRGPAASGPVSISLQPTPVLFSTKRRSMPRPLEETASMQGVVEQASA